MTREELIGIASEGYPDGLVAQYWNKEKQCVDLRANHGDGLARFVAVELSETYDAEVDDDAQLGEAVRAMSTAIRELTSVVRILAYHMGKDKDGKPKKAKKTRKVEKHESVYSPVKRHRKARKHSESGVLPGQAPAGQGQGNSQAGGQGKKAEGGEHGRGQARTPAQV